MPSASSTSAKQPERKKLDSVTEEKNLDPAEVSKSLDFWFKNLTKPEPQKSGEKNNKALETQVKYFSDLKGAVQTIKGDSKKLDILVTQNNPFDFARNLQRIVGEILFLTGQLDPSKERGYYLYYFHYRQLERVAREQLYPTTQQIGVVEFAVFNPGNASGIPEPASELS